MFGLLMRPFLLLLFNLQRNSAPLSQLVSALCKHTSNYTV